jgi:hypothetical protein
VATREDTRNGAPAAKNTVSSRHGRISNRSPNQKYIAGKNRAHSNTSRAETEMRQKGSRSHGMQTRQTAAGSKESTCSAWRTPRDCDSVTTPKIQEIQRHIIKIPATRRGSLAAEQEMLQAPLAYPQASPPAVAGGGL